MSDLKATTIYSSSSAKVGAGVGWGVGGADISASAVPYREKSLYQIHNWPVSALWLTNKLSQSAPAYKHTSLDTPAGGPSVSRSRCSRAGFENKDQTPCGLCSSKREVRRTLGSLLRLSQWEELSDWQREVRHTSCVDSACLSVQGYLVKSVRSDTRSTVYSACQSGRSYLDKNERSDTRYIVYCACLSRRSYLVKCVRSDTRYIVYCVCLSGRSSLVKSERSDAFYIVYSACQSGRSYLDKNERSDTGYVVYSSKWAELSG